MIRMIEPIPFIIALVLSSINACVWYLLGTYNNKEKTSKCSTSFNQYANTLNISGHVFKMNNSACIGECVNCGLVITTTEKAWKEQIFSNSIDDVTGGT